MQKELQSNSLHHERVMKTENFFEKMGKNPTALRRLKRIPYSKGTIKKNFKS